MCEHAALRRIHTALFGVVQCSSAPDQESVLVLYPLAHDRALLVTMCVLVCVAAAGEEEDRSCTDFAKVSLCVHGL